jgi:hypothetical protein
MNSNFVSTTSKLQISPPNSPQPIISSGLCRHRSPDTETHHVRTVDAGREAHGSSPSSSGVRVLLSCTILKSQPANPRCWNTIGSVGSGRRDVLMLSYTSKFVLRRVTIIPVGIPLMWSIFTAALRWKSPSSSRQRFPQP